MDESPSQKYWDESIDLGDEDSEELMTREEAEELFKTEVRLWLEKNQSKVLGTPFAQAYKKPWTKKSSSANFLETTDSVNGGKNKRDK